MAHPGFFQRPASARRNTTQLGLPFLTAGVLITLAVSPVASSVTRSESSGLAFLDWLLSRHGLLTAATVVTLIGVTSLIRWVDLAGGGERVAKMVGARPIDPDTQDQDERRLRNVVEEMANMMSASRSYQNNVEMLNTAKQLLQQTLKIGQ